MVVRSMPDPGGEAACVSLEELWRSKVQAARQRFCEASARCRDAIGERLEALAPAPDGDYAVRRAAKEEAAALHEYMRVLQIFTDLVVHEKAPEE